MPQPRKKDQRSYGAYVKVTFDLFVPVDGTSIEDAVASAKSLKPIDCLDVRDGVDHNDSEIVLEGVHTRYN